MALTNVIILLTLPLKIQLYQKWEATEKTSEFDDPIFKLGEDRLWKYTSELDSVISMLHNCVDNCHVEDGKIVHDCNVNEYSFLELFHH